MILFLRRVTLSAATSTGPHHRTHRHHTTMGEATLFLVAVFLSALLLFSMIFFVSGWVVRARMVSQRELMDRDPRTSMHRACKLCMASCDYELCMGFNVCHASWTCSNDYVGASSLQHSRSSCSRISSATSSTRSISARNLIGYVSISGALSVGG